LIERRGIIDGSPTRIGDVVLGLESTGLHSNGYSLVRKVLSQKELKLHSEELLKPTRLYSKGVLAVKAKVNIKGICNITGGAFYDKIPRIIPKGMAVEIDKNSWRIPWIFSLIQKKAKCGAEEMYRTFNMGIGMVLVLSKADIDKTRGVLSRANVASHVIGEVVRGSGGVVMRE
ncbi:MAG: AIR synthase-related protein, partial [Candidatus Omnitrophota bacterium]|nr:AIR synthase-related protein [Candidatus Omnitrophota bacterium]